MLKQKAILATFDTLGLEEKRELLNKILDSAGILVRDYRSTELGGKIPISDTIEDFLKLSREEQFVDFISRIDDYFIYKKEDIQAFYKLYQQIKDKCNICIWKYTFRGDECYRETKNEFYLGFDPKRTEWEGVHIDVGYDGDDTFTSIEKEEFFNNMLYDATRCYICIPQSETTYQGSMLEKTYSTSLSDFHEDEDFKEWWNISNFLR